MKYDIEKAKSVAAVKGYEILADVWIDKRTPMMCRCICGQKCELTMKAISRGSKCSHCQYEQVGKKKGFVGRMKRTTESVSQFFLEHGCELLDEYKGCQTPMKFRCECGNESQIRWDHFKNGVRCGCVRKATTITLEIAKQIFADNNCELLALEYPGCMVKMPYKCKCGNTAYCSYSVMKNLKPHCVECGREKNRGENSACWIKDRELLTRRNKFKKKCYKMIEHTLNMVGKKKEGHTYDLLGYSPLVLQAHIESHPNWSRVKDKRWHLDHIFPIKAFVDHGIDDIKLINGLDNLQPITQRQNNVKNAKYNKKAFVEWLKTKGIE